MMFDDVKKCGGWIILNVVKVGWVYKFIDEECDVLSCFGLCLLVVLCVLIKMIYFEVK